MISIVIPVYNVENYINECVESVLKQKDVDVEIILVDDGSTDNSGIKCDEYARNNKRIKVIHKENEGLVKARLTGVENAKGDYVFSLDSDDVIYPGLLSHIENIIYLYQPEIVCFDLCEFGVKNPKTRKNNYEEGFYSGEKYIDIVNSFICNENKPFFTMGLVYGIVTKVVQKTLLLNALKEVPKAISLGEDLATTALLLRDANNLYITHFNGYGYRQVPNSISHRYMNKRITELQLLIGLLENAFYNSKIQRIPSGQIEKYVTFRVIKLFSDIACIDSITESISEMRRIDKDIYSYVKSTNIHGMRWKDKFKIVLLKTRFRGLLLLLFRIKYWRNKRR